MPATYYIWKWADNDLPGKPTEIVSQLCAGQLPPALQPFSPKNILGRLAKVADQRRNEMSELLIEAKQQPNGQAAFIQLCDPSSDSPWLADKLLWAVWLADLTLYCESNNRLVGLPKRNVVEVPDESRQLVDIGPADIPALLHTLGDRQHLAAVACYDRNGNMFQAWSHRQRYAVEWQILPDRDFSRHRIWVAGKPTTGQRRARLGSRHDLFANEILTMADVQKLWTEFLSNATQPANHVWREITQVLNKPGHPPRERHTQKDKAPPL